MVNMAIKNNELVACKILLNSNVDQYNEIGTNPTTKRNRCKIQITTTKSNQCIIGITKKIGCAK